MEHQFGGEHVTKENRIRLFDSEKWEVFIEEWLELKKGTEYVRVQRLGGKGDKGRDVVGYIKEATLFDVCEWDGIQCKHYKAPLNPSNILLDVAKIIYYTHVGDYTVPRKYSFGGPLGIGTMLSDFIDNPENFRCYVKKNWANKCAKQIIQNKNILLEDALLTHFNNFDFTIFKKILPKEIISEHSKHPNHPGIFGIHLQERPKSTLLPKEIKKYESNYINCLLEAYSSHDCKVYSNVSQILKDSMYYEHLLDSRISFYSAEQLDRLYRDSVDIGTFKDYSDQIFNGLKPLKYKKYEDGLDKVTTFENEATKINVVSNPLTNVANTRDAMGVCHHLANDNKINWIK